MLRTILCLFICAFRSFLVFGQGTVVITPLNAPIVVCSEAEFRVEHTIAQLSSITIALATGTSFVSSDQTVTCTLDLSGQLVVSPVNGIHLPSSFAYTVRMDCSLIPQPSAGGQNALTLVEQISTVPMVNGLSHQFEVHYPLLVQQDAQSDLTMSTLFDPDPQQCSRDRKFVYRNNGTLFGTFNGSVRFTNELCTRTVTSGSLEANINITSVTAEWSNGSINHSLTAVPGFNVTPTGISSEVIFTIVDLPYGADLVITEYFCPDVCLSPSCVTTLTLAWGCGSTVPNDLCRSDEFDAAIARTASNPVLGVTTDGPTGAGMGTLFPFDLTCPGGTLPWTYHIRNQSTDAPAYDVEVELVVWNQRGSEAGMKGFTYLYAPEMTIDGVVITPTTVETLEAAWTAASLGPLPLCIQDWPVSEPPPLWHVLYSVPRLDPNEVLELTFTTRQCCASDAAFNEPVDLNHWAVHVTGDNDCGVSIHGVNGQDALLHAAYPLGGHWMSTNAALPDPADVRWSQIFSPPVVHMLGPDPPASGSLCDMDAVEQFVITTTNFMADYGTNPEIIAQDQSDGSWNIHVRVDWQSEPGLALLPSSMRFTDGTITVLPETPVPSSEVQSNFSTTFLFRYGTGTGFNTFNALRLYLNRAAFHYDMLPCCPAKEGGPTEYTVRMYLEQTPGTCGGGCWIPVAETGADMAVHCPGCIAPGMITTVCELTRVNLGHEDANNDGLPDIGFPCSIDTATYPPDALVNVRLDRSIAGDELEARVTAYCVDGSSATWPSIILPTPYDYRNLYLELTIPWADDQSSLAGASDLQVTDVRFIYETGVPADRFELHWPNPANIVQKLDDMFFFQLDHQALQLQGAPSTFQCGMDGGNLDAAHTYTIVARFDVCGNFAPTDPDAPALDEWMHRSEMTANMYLSDLVHTAPVHGTANGLSLSDQILADPSYEPDGTEILFCEGWGGQHSFIAIDNIHRSSLVPGTDHCLREFECVGTVRIGGADHANLFPFEYREVPGEFQGLTHEVPAGYELFQDQLSSRIFVNDAFGAPVPTTFTRPALSTGSLSGLQIHQIQPGSYDPSAGGFNAGPLPPDVILGAATPLPTGDEFAETTYRYWMRPTCDAEETQGIDYGTGAFPTYGCQPGTEEAGNDHDLPLFTISVPSLTVSQPLDVDATTHEICWEISMGPEGSAVADPVIVLPSSAGFMFDHYTLDGLEQPVPPNGIIQLHGNGTADITVLLCGTMTFCTGTGLSLPLSVGWTCSPIDPDGEGRLELCGVRTADLVLWEEPATFDELQAPELQPPTVVLCEDFNVTYWFYSPYAGGVNDPRFSIHLQPGLTIVNSSAIPVVLGNGPVTNGLCTGQIHLTPNSSPLEYGQLVTVDPDCPVIANNGFEQLDWIAITVRYTTDCEFTGTLPLCILEGTTYCGDIVSAAASPLSATYGGTSICDPACPDRCEVEGDIHATPSVDGCTVLFEFIPSPPPPPGFAISYLWVLPDGTTTNAPSPSFTFNGPGSYTVHVSITFTGFNGVTCSRDLVLNSSAEACSCVTAAFEWSHQEGGAFQFSSTSSACPPNTTAIHRWDFGDGTPPADIPDPTHVFQTRPPHTVCLHVQCIEDNGNTVCESTYCQQVSPTGKRRWIETRATEYMIQPNPTRGTFELVVNAASDEHLEVRIIDTQGRTVQLRNLEHASGVARYAFNMGNGHAGVYVLEVQGKDHRARLQLIHTP